MTEMNGHPVQVYCPKPRFEIVRGDRLYKAGRQAARNLGIDFSNVIVDLSSRIVTKEDGTIIAWQDQSNW